MQEHHIVCYSSAILIDTFGRLLLQRRDNKPSIMHPGKVSLFGGRSEAGESPLECIVREIGEEIGYAVNAERFDYLISLYAPYPEYAGGYVRGDFFVATEIPTDQLVINEGKLLILAPQDIAAIRGELETMTSAAMHHFFSRETRPY
jgi:8-oxo-dGTP diphosphatase